MSGDGEHGEVQGRRSRQEGRKAEKAGKSSAGHVGEGEDLTGRTDRKSGPEDQES